MKKNNISATDIASEYILKMIKDMNFDDAIRLPSERELANLIKVSRVSVRSALDELRIEGIVEIKPNAGIFVKKKKIVMDLSDLRSFKDEMSFQKLEYRSRVVSQKVIEANKTLTQKFSVKLGHKIFELIRIRFVNNIPLLYQIVYLDYERFLEIDKIDFSTNSQYSIMKDIYNTSIVSGKERIGLVYTTKIESELLEVDHNTPAFYFSSSNYDEEGILTEYDKKIVRYDMISYKIEKKVGTRCE